MSKLLSDEKWIIVSKDRTVIATGYPRDRRLTLITDSKDKRILTYSTKGRAENAFSGRGRFLQEYKEHWRDPDKPLEAIKIRVTYEEVLDE